MAPINAETARNSPRNSGFIEREVDNNKMPKDQGNNRHVKRLNTKHIQFDINAIHFSIDMNLIQHGSFRQTRGVNFLYLSCVKREIRENYNGYYTGLLGPQFKEILKLVAQHKIWAPK